MEEKWRIVEQNKNYEVSSHGRVRRIGKAPGAVLGRVLKPRSLLKGHQLVDLSERDRKVHCYVHRLVATAFIRDPQGEVVHHVDHDPRNNRVDNLAVMTYKENNHACIEAGRHPGIGPKGEAHGRSKLTAAEVCEIRRLRLEEGVGRNALAERYGISKCHITAITKGRAWRHLLDTDAGEVTVQ